MTRFSGEVGYNDGQQEVSPGVWEDVIVEKTYFGDVDRSSRKLLEGEKVNQDLSVVNTISVVADAYAMEHFFAIRYIRWQGALFTVTEVEVRSPRLVLRLGGVYNGRTYVAP